MRWNAYLIFSFATTRISICFCCSFRVLFHFAYTIHNAHFFDVSFSNSTLSFLSVYLRGKQFNTYARCLSEENVSCGKIMVLWNFIMWYIHHTLRFAISKGNVYRNNWKTYKCNPLVKLNAICLLQHSYALYMYIFCNSKIRI